MQQYGSPVGTCFPTVRCLHIMISRGNITGLLQEVSHAMWDHQV
jgi:hypothetical protein